MNNKKFRYKIVLLSNSTHKEKALEQIFIKADLVVFDELQEDKNFMFQLKNELPSEYSKRIALEKCKFFHEQYKDCIFISSNSIISVGKRILHKPKDENEALKQLDLLSGRRNRIYSSFCIFAPNLPLEKNELNQENESIDKSQSETKIFTKQNFSIIKFKKLETIEMNEYIKRGSWQHSYGVYSPFNEAASFINFMSGSFSSASFGIPLFELSQVLKQYKIS